MRFLRFLLVVVFLFVFCSFLVSAENVDVRFYFDVFEGSVDFSNGSLYYLVDVDNGSLEGFVSLDSEGSVLLSVPVGVHSVLFAFDDFSSDGFDFFAESQFVFDGSDSEFLLYFLPVGSLELEFVDLSGRQVSDVLVKVDCRRPYGLQGYFSSDDFGLVSVDFLPLGRCVARFAFEDFVDSSEFSVVEGDLLSLVVEVPVDRGGFSFIYFVFVGIVVFAVLVFLVVRYGTKRDLSESVVVSGNSSREDILKVLSVKERLVVNFLVDSIGSEAGFVSQADIVHGAGIAKTSLMRVLDGLESKKIVLVEKFGKSKRIYLTKWFLSLN
ncbi:hypothetical protein K9L97_02755 [Candidatus Woesearchaeota archaeon]|nr:hypothetical protein [Candidatus Woesearchaeota archaeon]